MKRAALLRQCSYVAGSEYFGEALSMLRGLAAAYLLGPVVFGAWAAIRLMLMFTSFVDAGTNSAMVQCAPHAEGAGAKRRAEAHRRVSAGVTLGGASAAALLAAVVFNAWVPGEVSRHGWWLVALLILVEQLQALYEDALASRRQFGWMAVTETGFGVLSTVGCILGAMFAGLDGFLAGMVGAYVVVVVVCPLIGPPMPRPVWRLRHALRLVHIGWQMVAGQLMLVLLWNMDKLLLWALRPSAELGVYALQSYFTLAIMMLPGAVAEVVLPHLRMRLGQDPDSASVRQFLLEGTRLLALAGLPIIGLGFLLLHLPLRWVLSDYAGAIEPGRVLMLGSFFSFALTLGATVLIARSCHVRLIAIRVIAIVAAGVLIGAVLVGGGSLGGVAWAMVGALVLNAIMTLATALRISGVGAAAAGRWMWSIVGPFVAMLVVLVALMHWIPDRPETLGEDVLLTGARCVLLMLVLSPIGWHLLRRLRRPGEPAAQAIREGG